MKMNTKLRKIPNCTKRGQMNHSIIIIIIQCTCTVYSSCNSLTCQSSALQCLSVLMLAYSDLCHTEHSSNQHRMDGYPKKNQTLHWRNGECF